MPGDEPGISVHGVFHGIGIASRWITRARAGFTRSIPTMHSDEYWMTQALAEAEAAEAHGEVPVGAVVVLDDKLIGSGWNQPIGRHDPSAHAEVMALRDAGTRRGNYRLAQASLFVTLEPCLMCVGALVHARIARLVYGAPDPKSGAVDTCCRGFELPGLNHRLAVTAGVRSAECGELLRRFFRVRRG